MTRQQQEHHNRTHFLLEEMVTRYDQMLDALVEARDELVSTNSIVRRGAEAREITNGASRRISASPGQLVGWSIRETVNDYSFVRLRDGLDASGAVIAVLSPANGGTSTLWCQPGGIAFTTGLYVDVSPGAAIEGVVYIGPLGRS